MEDEGLAVIILIVPDTFSSTYRVLSVSLHIIAELNSNVFALFLQSIKKGVTLP